MKKLVILLILSILVFPTILAAGLQIQGNNVFEITKTEDETKTITFNLTNDDYRIFKNVTFESNYFLQMEPINNFAPGSSQEVTADVIGVSDFNGNISIEGFYETTTGILEEQHNITINYPNEPSICDLTAVVGDTVAWKNTGDSSISIVMINAVTFVPIATIPAGENYTETFNLIDFNLKYYFSMMGDIFTPTCELSVIAAEGLVTNSDFDAVIHLNLHITYLPTEILVTTFTNDYEINAGTTVTDVLRIKNIGNETARNIYLEGEWFSFFGDNNNFNLHPGVWRNIEYTIIPFLGSTNETDETYNKSISISGNFDTQTRDFNIYIPFAIIDETQVDKTTLDALMNQYIETVNAYCIQFPNKEICDFLKSSIITQQGVNQTTLTSQQFREFVVGMIDFIDSSTADNSVLKSQIQTLKDANANNTEIQSQMFSILTELQEQQKGEISSALLVGLIIVSLAIIAALGYIILMKRKQKLLTDTGTYR